MGFIEAVKYRKLKRKGLTTVMSFSVIYSFITAGKFEIFSLSSVYIIR